MSSTTIAAATTLENLFANQAAAFAAAPYPLAGERRRNLTRLLDAILAHQDALATAIDHDFGGRSRDEVLFSEIYVAVNAIRHARRHLKGWMEIGRASCRERA